MDRSNRAAPHARKDYGQRLGRRRKHNLVGDYSPTPLF
jgi:hypothetical protein